MRTKGNAFNVDKSLMRMGWNPVNVYNTWKRNSGPLTPQYNFKKSKDSLFQLRFRSKQHLRAYWGAKHLEDKQFRRWYLPASLPLIVPSAQTSPTLNPKSTSITRYSHPGKEGGRHLVEQDELFRYHGSQAPVGPLMFREIERRLDHVLFRGGFARSVDEARGLLSTGSVRLNGNVERQYQIRLLPGDFLEVDPSRVSFLNVPSGTSILAALDSSVSPISNRQLLVTEPVKKADEEEEEEEEGEEGEGRKVNGGEGWKVVYRARLSNLLGMNKEEVNEVVERGQKYTKNLWLRRWNAIQKKEAAAQDTLLAHNLAGLTLSEPTEGDSPSWQRPVMKPLTPTHSPPLPSDPPGTRHFNLPPFSGPSLFIPPYLQPNFAYCTLTYLRHPTARHKYEEIPSPFDAKGDLMKSAWEWYTMRRIRMKTYPGGLFPGGIDARARSRAKRRGPEIKRSGVVEDYY